MTTHLLRRCVVTVTTLALAVSSLTLVTSPAHADETGVTGAPASRQKTVVEVSDQTTVIEAAPAAAGAGLELGTAAGAAPEDVLLSVPDLVPVSGLIGSEIALGDGVEKVAPLKLTLTAAGGPEGASATVTDPGTVDDAGDDTILWDTTGDAGQSIEVPDEGIDAVWAFTATGRYTFEVQASLQVTDTSGAITTVTSPAATYTFTVGGVAEQTTTTLTANPATASAGDAVTLTASVTPADASGAVEFYDGNTLLGHTDVAAGEPVATASFEMTAAEGSSFTASFVPTWSTDFTASVSDPVTPAAGTDGVEDDLSDGTVQGTAADAATTKTTDDAVPTVLSAGDVALTPQLSGVSEDGKDFTSFDVGLLDKTGAYADQTWYSAEDAVLQLTDAEHDEATGAWSTPASVDDVASYTTGDGARLLLGVDRGRAAGGINESVSSAMSAVKQQPTTLTGLTGPDGGVLTVTDSSGTVLWDSSKLDDGSFTQGELKSPAAVTNRYFGWSFTEAGRYCVTFDTLLRSNGTKADITQATTVTVYVGDITGTPTTCAQPGGEDPGDTTDRVALPTGHSDVRARLSDDGTALKLGLESDSQFYDTADMVMAGPTAATIPENTDGADWSFLGDSGNTYWYFPQVQTTGSSDLWPGFSTENFVESTSTSTTQTKLAPGAQIEFTLTGTSGPEGGDAVLFYSNTAATADMHGVYFSTKNPMPQTTAMSSGSHSHLNWGFTAQGRYCLAMSVKTQLADGAWVSDTGQITVWVGDASEAASVVPCDRDTEPVVETASPVTVSTVDEAIITGYRLAAYTPYLTSDGELSVATRLAESPSNTAMATVPADDVVVTTTARSKAAGGWTFTGGSTAAPYAHFDTDSIVPGTIDGGLTIRMGTVEGPGTVEYRRVYGNYPYVNSADGTDVVEFAVNSTTHTGGQYWVVSEPGIYCVPITVEVTPAGASEPIRTSYTMTLVAGSDDPSSADYVDKSALTTCSRGQQPTTGGDDEPTPPVQNEPGWDVPNGSTTDSGATILNDGHIDVASVVTGDTLGTLIKDTTYEGIENGGDEGVSWHDPENTVLQLLPSSQTKVPAADAYAFLGQEGATFWQVSETQQEGLLWPGWSTELIAHDATRTGVTWTLDGIEGPGEFALYQTPLSGPSVLFNTRDGITGADSFTIGQGVHAHGSWAFSAEGTYCLAFTRSTTLADGTGASDDFTLAVAVGEVDVKKIDPSACFADSGEPTEQDLTPTPASQLTDDNAGGVQVLGSDQAIYPGQLVTVQVGAERAGDWVSVWLDDDSWLGWAQVGSSGAAQVRLPSDAALGSHKLVAEARDGGLIGWDALALVAPPDGGDDNPPPGDDDDPGEDPGTLPGCEVTATIIDHGHLDYSTQVVNGKLESLIGDDSSGTKVFREPSQTVLWLKPSSKVTLGAGYEQVAPAGSSVYLGPQTQNQDLIWLGWSTELVNASTLASPVTWTIDQVEGPGRMSVFLQGEFGGIQQVVFDNGGSYQINLGVHAHANWTFTEQGIYRLRMTQTATLAGGQTSSDSETLTIVVGDVDPATAVAGGADCVNHVPGGGGANVSASPGGGDSAL